MDRPDARAFMWFDAIDVLARAERLHRQMFEPAPGRRKLCWEPPVDIVEMDGQVLVLAALPGVDPKDIEVRVNDGALLIAGERVLPPEFKSATIHRLELPQGCFERSIPLPPGRYELTRPTVVNGCLSVVLRKTP